jgi:predicted membrane-bound mannosyltransferase
MTDTAPPPGQPPSLIERRVRRIVNARSVTIGLALTFVGLAVVGALVMRVADSNNFPSVWLAIWWALQTVTTVGYGDVVPTTVAGRIVGGVEMVVGVAFIAFVTAGVTSSVIQRGGVAAEEADRARDELNAQTILAALTQTRQSIAELGDRLVEIESKLSR